MRQNVMIASVSKNLSDANKKLLNSKVVINSIDEIDQTLSKDNSIDSGICFLHRMLADKSINNEKKIALLDVLSKNYRKIP